MSANVFLRGASDQWEDARERPRASTERRGHGRATRYASRVHSRSPRPARCLGNAGADA